MKLENNYRVNRLFLKLFRKLCVFLNSEIPFSQIGRARETKPEFEQHIMNIPTCFFPGENLPIGALSNAPNRNHLH
jgi:hypothetical protein